MVAPVSYQLIPQLFELPMAAEMLVRYGMDVVQVCLDDEDDDNL